MPDEELDPAPDPLLDPETDARVRRLLAEARSTDPVPADVAARLDATLADLAAQRRTHPAPVVDLAARRRRRVGAGLLAAAATVVVGVSLPGLVDAGGDDSASETATGGVAEDSQGDAAGGDTETRELASPGTAPGPDDGAESAAPELPTEIPAQPLRPGTFKRDAEAARVNGSAMTESLRRPVDCGDLPTGAVQLVPVTYDGSLGYLAFDPPEADGQRVALYLCPAGELVREAVLPAP